MTNSLPPTDSRREGASTPWNQARVDGLRKLAREVACGAPLGRSIGTYRAVAPVNYHFPDGFQPLLAADPAGLLHLLLPVDTARSVREDHESVGVILTARELVAEDGRRVAYADLECRSVALSDTYLLLADEVLARVARENGLHPDIAARDALNGWRELLTRTQTERLSVTALAGLFGELTFIRDGVDSSALLKAWAGPDRKRHDFQIGVHAAEIKTTMSADSERIVVHGMSQLESQNGGQLFLLRYRLERAPQGESVPELIEQICARGVSAHELFTSLNRAGYSHDDHPFYSTVRFSLRKRQAWRVADGFPRLSTSSFIGGSAPPGIQILRYELDLSMAQRWECEYAEVRGALKGA